MTALEIPGEFFVLVLTAVKLEVLVLVHMVRIKDDRHDRELVVISCEGKRFGLSVRARHTHLILIRVLDHDKVCGREWNRVGWVASMLVLLIDFCIILLL
jgi:hypothetical protein